MKCAAYIRVSSASQDHAMQLNAISRASRARGDKVVDIYEEKRSAKTNARPVLEELRRAAREGRIARLYVWRLDRLTRSGIRETLDLVDELRRHGCDVVTIADGFELAGPAAEVVLAVLAWAAQMELLAGNERRAAAREHVLSRGGTWGRPRRVTEALERHAMLLARDGKSVRAIAVALKVPRATVGRMLVRGRLKSPSQKTPARTRKNGRRRNSEHPASQ